VTTLQPAGSIHSPCWDLPAPDRRSGRDRQIGDLGYLYILFLHIPISHLTYTTPTNSYYLFSLARGVGAKCRRGDKGPFFPSLGLSFSPPLLSPFGPSVDYL